MDTQDEIDAAEAALAVLRKKRDAELAKTLVRCDRTITPGHKPGGCGMALEIGELIYIQTNWYVRPYGCTGGDYYKQGEAAFVCPKCGGRNRLYPKPEIVALKRHFKSVVEEYDKD